MLISGARAYQEMKRTLYNPMRIGTTGLKRSYEGLFSAATLIVRAPALINERP
jgi:hypothetical protein